jgi:hypothetical protein
MTRHRFPLIALFACLLAPSIGLIAGCGSSASSDTTAATSTTPASQTQTAVTSSTTPRTAKPATPAATAKAVLSNQVHTPPTHRFIAAPINQAGASQLARTGTIVVPVAVGGPGTISGFGQAEIPRKGILHVAEAAPKHVRAAGIVDLTYKLTPLARAQLAAGKSIDMFVAVSFSKGEVIQRMEVHLKP